MSDLTDNELQAACTSSDRLVQHNRNAYVIPHALASAALLQRAALEIRRHRAAVRADRERVRAVVEGELAKCSFQPASRLRQVDDGFAGRVADALDSSCDSCGDRLMFSARARGNGLCGPCTRDSAGQPSESARGVVLSDDEHGELRRVKQIVYHLHTRQPSAWGDPLDGCVAVLDKLIAAHRKAP